MVGERDSQTIHRFHAVHCRYISVKCNGNEGSYRVVVTVKNRIIAIINQHCICLFIEINPFFKKYLIF